MLATHLIISSFCLIVDSAWNCRDHASTYEETIFQYTIDISLLDKHEAYRTNKIDEQLGQNSRCMNNLAIELLERFC